jgi:3-hydroxybutyryl-CoA dehydrogenase
MLINDAAGAVPQGLNTTDGADAARGLGVNDPIGPFESITRCGVPKVVAPLETLNGQYRARRQRANACLRRQALAASRRT